MRKLHVAPLALALATSLVLAGCGSDSDGSSGDTDYKKKLTLGTGSTGGVYYPLGNELSTVLNKNVKQKGFNVSSVESGASVENIAKMHKGKYQLGIAQNTTGFDAIRGKADFKGKKVNDFGVVASLYPEALTAVTLKNKNIDTVGDLKGKKVAIGPPGGATRAAAEKLLKAYGIGKGDYKAYKEGFDDAKDKLQNGTIDAAISVVGVPSSATADLQASTGKVKMLSMNDKAVKQFTDDTDYTPYTIKSGTYDWYKKPVKTVTAMAVLMASKKQVSKKLAYQLTKQTFANTDDMSIDQAKLIKKSTALKGCKGLPIHPGAKKFYKEEGIKAD